MDETRTCHKCDTLAVWVDNVPGKEYFYCRGCKVEVEEKPTYDWAAAVETGDSIHYHSTPPAQGNDLCPVTILGRHKNGTMPSMCNPCRDYLDNFGNAAGSVKCPNSSIGDHALGSCHNLCSYCSTSVTVYAGGGGGGANFYGASTFPACCPGATWVRGIIKPDLRCSSCGLWKGPDTSWRGAQPCAHRKLMPTMKFVNGIGVQIHKCIDCGDEVKK